MPHQEMAQSPAHPGDTKLFTRDGGYVTTVRVPPMNPPPEVVQWGTRIFVLQGGAYREGIVWFSNEAPR